MICSSSRGIAGLCTVGGCGSPLTIAWVSSGIASREWTPPGHHLIEHDPQGIDIAAVVQRVTPDLLGRSVVDAAYQRFRNRNLLMAGSTGQPEVHHLDLAPAVKHQVLRLNITVNDIALAIGHVEGISDLGRVFNRQMLKDSSINIEQV